MSKDIGRKAVKMDRRQNRGKGTNPESCGVVISVGKRRGTRIRRASKSRQMERKVFLLHPVLKVSRHCGVWASTGSCYKTPLEETGKKKWKRKMEARNDRKGSGATSTRAEPLSNLLNENWKIPRVCCVSHFPKKKATRLVSSIYIIKIRNLIIKILFFFHFYLALAVRLKLFFLFKINKILSNKF